MASFDYKGKSYFNVFGKWVDAQSRPVKPEISRALDELYSKAEVKARENSAKKSKPKVSKNAYNKINSNAVYLTTSNKPKKKAATKNFSTAKSQHKKARQQYFQANVELTSDQKKALALLEKGDNVFITGEAGTGKSFVLNEYLRRNSKKNIIVCAPTGIAAINVGGSTIHRVFNAPLGVARPGEFNSAPSEPLINADVIVIDEISMCRFDLFEYVVRTIKKAEEIRQNNANIEALKEGKMPRLLDKKKIIVIGDFFQLAPVITPKDKEILSNYWENNSIGDGFAFISPLWAELEFKNIVLKEIVRQINENDYVENLNKIRIGDYSGIEWFNNYISMQPISGGIYLCGTNLKADGINQKESEKLSGKPRNYKAEIKGAVGESDKMTRDDLTLKIGMQVMTLVNDTSEGFQNGSIGKITALADDHVDVRLNNGKEVTVKAHDWEILGYEMQEENLEKVVLGNFKQIPLKIAYAITIHKSQGQTYSSVNISPDCFADGQLYVALSRAKTANGMSLEHRITRSALKTSQAVKDFYEHLIECDNFDKEKKESESKSADNLQLSLFDMLNNESPLSKSTEEKNLSTYDTAVDAGENPINLPDMYTSIDDFPFTNTSHSESIKEEGDSNQSVQKIDIPNMDDVELPWSDNTSLIDTTENRSSIYDKVMSMDDDTVNSCKMYTTIKKHPNAYAPWTDEEDEQLIQELVQELSIKRIAEIHKRNNGAIRARIKKLYEIYSAEEDTGKELISSDNTSKNEEVSTPKPNPVSSKGTVATYSGKNTKTTKTDFRITTEEASEFYYEQSISIGSMRDRLNTLRNASTTKQITSKRILEYLSDNGLMREEFIDGVWQKVISEKGKQIGIHFVKSESSRGTEYLVPRLSRQAQKMIIDFFTVN